MSEKIVVHVSEVNISQTSGMGRVEYYWKKSFEKQGYKFVHIGPDEVGKLIHKGLFSSSAYSYFKKLNIEPTLFIVHEAAASSFINRGTPCFIESHGVERRAWEGYLKGLIPSKTKISFKTKLLFPIWRLSGCDKGLKYADKLLLINSDDKTFVKAKYKREDEDIFMFKNGIMPIESSSLKNNDSSFTVLFNATWIERKGINVLINAAEYIYTNTDFKINYLLIGTGASEQDVVNDWPGHLKKTVKVVSKFKQNEEVTFLNSSSLFVLPSYAEGQPLSLLQAMAAGKCCITTNCCGQKDIVQNNVTGLLFEPGDYIKMANLIINCYNNPELIKTIGANAKQYIDKYTWDVVSDEVVDFVLKNV